MLAAVAMPSSSLETERLLLRQWRDEDFAPFAELNADPVAMEYFPAPLQRDESDAMAEECRQLIAERGWGLWATCVKHDGCFVGFVGLHRPRPDFPLSPCVEIGWRLRREHWGNGYATEAATRVLRFAFEDLALEEVASFTTVSNYRSRAVMERLGMVNTRRNFMHPDVAPNHPVAEHVLYKLRRSAWLEKATGELRDAEIVA